MKSGTFSVKKCRKKGVSVFGFRLVVFFWFETENVPTFGNRKGGYVFGFRFLVHFRVETENGPDFRDVVKVGYVFGLLPGILCAPAAMLYVKPDAQKMHS